MNLLDDTYDGGGDGYDTDIYDNDFLGEPHDGDGDEEQGLVSEHGDYCNDADDFENRQLALDGDEY